MANLDINAIIQQPLTDETYGKLADAIKRALEVGGGRKRSQKKKAMPRDLSNRGLPPASVKKTLEKVWQYLDMQEWALVYRYGYDLVAEGVDWVPQLASVVSYSCLHSNHRHQCIVAAQKSISTYPEQAVAYVTVAIWKFEKGCYRDALLWLDLASLGINNIPKIWTVEYDHYLWALNQEKKKMDLIWPYIKAPHFLAKIQMDPRYHYCLLNLDPALEGLIASIREKEDIYDDYIQNPSLKKLFSDLWPLRALFIQPFPVETDLKKSQPQASLGKITQPIFHQIVKYDARLSVALGSTCKALLGWSNSITTWEAICQHRFPHVPSDMQHISPTYAKNLVLYEHALREACDLILTTPSVPDLRTQAVALVAKYQFASPETFASPMRLFFALLSDLTSFDETEGTMTRIVENVPTLVQALLVYLTKCDYSRQLRSTCRVLITLLLRGGPSVMRRMDMFGMSEFVRCASLCFGGNEAKALHSAIISAPYFMTLPLCPVLMSSEWMTRLKAEERDVFAQRLSGVWHLAIIDIGVQKEQYFERAIVKLQFDGAKGSVEGSGFSSIGAFKLVVGLGSFSLERCTIYFYIKHDCSPNTTLTFDGTTHAQGFGGRFGIQNAATTRNNAAKASLYNDPDPHLTKSDLHHGSWIMCKDARHFDFGTDFPPVYQPTASTSPTPAPNTSDAEKTSNDPASSVKSPEEDGAKALDFETTASGAAPSAGSESSASENGSAILKSKEMSEASNPTQTTAPGEKQTEESTPIIPVFPPVKIDPSLSAESAIACWSQYCSQLVEIGRALGSFSATIPYPVPSHVSAWYSDLHRAVASCDALLISEITSMTLNEIEARNPEISAARTLEVSKRLLRLEIGQQEPQERFLRRQALYDRCYANVFEMRLLLVSLLALPERLKSDIECLLTFKPNSDLPDAHLEEVYSPEICNTMIQYSFGLSWMSVNPYEIMRSPIELAQFLQLAKKTYPNKVPIPQTSSLIDYLTGSSTLPSTSSNAENDLHQISRPDSTDIDDEEDDDPFSSKNRRNRSSSSSGLLVPIIAGVCALLSIGAGISYVLRRRRN